MNTSKHQWQGVRIEFGEPVRYLTGVLLLCLTYVLATVAAITTITSKKAL